MRKHEWKPGNLEPETPGGGIGAAFVQDLELTAEQIKEAAEKAVVAVEKIAGLKPAAKARNTRTKKGTGTRREAAPAKSGKKKNAGGRKRK